MRVDNHIYIAYDDMGVIKKGKKYDVLDELIKTVNSKKIKEIYSKKERAEMLDFIIPLYNKEFDQVNFFGFTIDKFRG
jgi:hypothetical protein